MWLIVELLLVIGKVLCLGTVITQISALLVEGFVHPDYKPVLEAFKRNLHKGWERDGAAFAVYHNGRMVIDIWGGFADFDSCRPWREDTMSIAFSSSKAVGAVCVALLVDRKLVSYDDKVASFWPEFATRGKEEITLQMVMEHTAGLPLIDHKITFEEASDWVSMSNRFEDQKPIWKPGTRVGYHALTFGWLVDLIIRRVDPGKRGVGQFFREEIAIPHNIDFHFGLPVELTHRVSRIRKPSMWNRVEEWLADPETVDYRSVFKNYLTNGLMLRVVDNATWLQSIFRVTLNNPELYRLEQCAALGIGTSRSLAKLMQLYMDGKIVSKQTVELTSHPTVVKMRDCVTYATTDRGWGFTHSHFAYKLCFAYLSNGLKSGLGDRARPYVQLLRALYSTLPERNNNKLDLFHVDTSFQLELEE
ncbi:unnamed protein product, partial [Mesorhabditis spiculigera]